MKKLFYVFLGMVCFGMVCCSKGEGEYVVKGETSQERLEGHRVFLVPYGSPTIEDSIGVDSTEIKNGKFEFRGNKGEFLARVTMDRKVRYGTQDLLIVTEPGEINVVIDSVSSGRGTPQNDALQTWKELKENRDRVAWTQSQHIKWLEEKGDTAYARSLSDSLRNFNERYLDQVRGVMRKIGKGTAYDLLKQRYGEP